MYKLRKVFSDRILLSAVILLSLALVTSCQHKKIANSSSNPDAAPQELHTAEAEEDRPQLVASEGAKPADKASLDAVQKARLPRLIDLGADKCIPCKMMAPILEELKEEYAGKFEVVFIDVWKAPEKGREYGIRVIPTQIFYDTNGEEFFRHVGFFSKEDILKTFSEKGINFNED